MPGSAPAGRELTSNTLGVPGWSALSLGNGWTNTGGGQVTAQWRYWPLINEIEVIGTITPGTITDGTVIASGLTPTPASIQNQAVQVQGNSAAPVQTPTLTLVTSGALEVFHMPSGMNEMAFHLWYSLDA